MSDPTLPVQQPALQRGFGLPVEQNPTVPGSDYEGVLAKRKRQELTSGVDLMGSMWRQDSITNGAMASLAGSQLEADPSYFVGSDPEFKSLTAGIQTEFLPALYQSRSAAHAQYQRGLILQKQDDLQKLGDMGALGDVGRFAFGLLNPENLAMGMVGGWVSKGVRSAQIAAEVGTSVTPVARAAAEATVNAAGGGTKALAAGVLTGAAENAAFEKLRQSVNFEDSNTDVLMAGLMGSAFTAPFAYAGARQASRVASSAKRELEVLTALKDHSEGRQLTPEQGKAIAATHRQVELVNKLHSGDITVDEYMGHLDGSKMVGPVEPADVWLQRMPGRVAEQADDIIRTYFPGSLEKPLPRAPKGVPTEMPASQAEIAAANAAQPQAAAMPHQEALQSLLDQQRMAKTVEEQASHTAALDKAIKKARAEAFQAAEQADAATKAADHERAIKQRELQRWLGEDPQPVPAAPPAPQVDPAMAALREKWRGLADKPDSHVRATEAWDSAKQRLVELTGSHNTGDRIHDTLVDEWGQPRIAKDQEGYLAELEKRLRAAGDELEVLRKTPGTVEFKRLEKKLQEQWKSQQKAMHKAAQDEILIALQELRELHAQGRLGPDDLARLEAARGIDNSSDLADELHKLASQKNSLSDTLPVGRESAPAANDAPPPKPQHEHLLGTEVHFTDKNGDYLSGTFRNINETTGKAMIVEDGHIHSVPLDSISEYRSGVPAGFLPGSIGAAQHMRIGSFVDEASSRYVDSGVSVPGTNGKVKIPVRLDLYALLNASKVDQVRALGHMLVLDPVAQKDGSAQQTTATEHKAHLIRTIGRNFHFEAAQALDKAWKAAGLSPLKKGEFREWFYESASKDLRGDHTVLVGVKPDVAAQVQAAGAAMRSTLDGFLAEASKAGVKGAQGVTSNDAYVNRVWRADRIREAMDLHGEARVHELIADSMYGMNSKGPLTGNLDKARSFLGVIMKSEFNQALQNVHLAGRDMATLRGELRAYGLDDADINTIVDTMFVVKETSGSDAGQAQNLKYRFELDETIVKDTPAGKLRLSDLMENDARKLVDLYGNSMAGHTALARVGIKSQAEWAAELKLAGDQMMRDPAGLGGDSFTREMAWLQDIHRNLLGQPMSMHDNTGPARIAGTARAFARAASLGQLGITAALELNHAIGVMGVRAFITQVPSFGAFLSALRRGYLPDVGLARDVRIIGGWGQEKVSAYARAREVSESLAVDSLNAVEHWGNKMSHAVDIASGNASFTSLTKQISATMSVQRMHDYATGLKKLTPEAKARLSGFGLEGPDLTDTLKAFRDHADVVDGVVKAVRYQDWHAADPETYTRFQTYMSRQVRDSIQEHDLGETMPWMHSTLGKVFAELRTFMLVGHAKNMLKNLHYQDATSFQVLSLSLMAEALAYSIQTAINYPDELDKRLTPERIGTAAMSRASIFGMGAMVADTGYGMLTGGESMFQPGTTANTDNRNFFTPPAVQTMRHALYTAPMTLGGALTGQGLTTRQEFLDSVQPLPFRNLYGIRGAVNLFADQFPKRDPAHPWQ